jgi:hypothetical protein
MECAGNSMFRRPTTLHRVALTRTKTMVWTKVETKAAMIWTKGNPQE